MGWLLRDGFGDMVKEICESGTDEEDSMRRWQYKIRRLRKQLRGWAKNVSGVNKKEKKGLLDKLDMLDKRAEASLLSAQEANLKQCLHNRLSQLLREEEIK
jgi:outer membrane protein TolC